jgi:hypothetical protein
VGISLIILMMTSLSPFRESRIPKVRQRSLTEKATSESTRNFFELVLAEFEKEFKVWAKEKFPTHIDDGNLKYKF